MADNHDVAAASPPPINEPAVELLAPAGDWASLEAALESGANAVYLGMQTLNARRYAANFDRHEFARAIEFAHQHGAKVYLTLNVDISERELGLAARTLWWAEQSGTDAVLIRDPALLALAPHFPRLEFHFSTQSCIASSADAEAAAALGIARVVLAREMSLREIRAASQTANLRTEVFVQGSLCFCVSGRCFLSSWTGGRSGNRGRCTSPCRVPWTADGVEAEAPFSMRDLATAHRTKDLIDAGVSALKIEGRMKNAAWVRRAVAVYRQALSGDETTGTQPEVDQLGAYTGRSLTSGYLDGQLRDLTGVAGREAGDARESRDGTERRERRDDEAAEFDLSIQVSPQGIQCECASGGRSEQWRLPKTVVRRKHKAVPIGAFLTWLGEHSPRDCLPRDLSTNDPDYLLVPRAANGILDRVTSVVRRAKKKSDELIGIDLPDNLRPVLEKGEPASANRLYLGRTPDRVRVDASAVAAVVRECKPQSIIVERVTAGTMSRVQRAAGKTPLLVALPTVFFENQVSQIADLLARCQTDGVPVEVNSWGGWQMARAAGLKMEGGPGLPVLNSLAARKLAELGLRSVTLSVEADRRKLEEVTAHCPAPCSLVVFGRPPLMISRAQLSEEEFRNKILEDRRNVRIKGRREQGLWVFRPAEPFDLRDLQNDRIRVTHLVVDLVGSDDPVGDFHHAPSSHDKPFRFNYGRKLAS